MANVSDTNNNIYKKRAREIINQMTLQEKVEQMLFEAPENKKFGIKEYNWWNEALHGSARSGTATVFPQAIGLAATFNDKLLEKIGDVVATEVRAKYNAFQKYKDYGIYKGITIWSPNVNIFRDPRWGRGQETFGEDPYLTSRLGVAYINGLQGKNDKYLKVAACAKHYAVHSGPENSRHYFDVKMQEPMLSETYLYAFKACVKESKVETVMGAYNKLNGVPCCGNKFLLRDTLREKWGFDGYTMSDCWAIVDFYKTHFYSDSPKQAAADAVNGGCDLNCGCTYPYLVDAVKDGLIDEKTIDDSLENLFVTRLKLGELEKTPDCEYDNIPYSIVDCKEYQKFNLEVAKKTLVLFKNDGILPLNKKKIKSIGVIGPNANSRDALEGNYKGTASRYITVLEGIQDYLKDTDVTVRFSDGCHMYRDTVEGFGRKGDKDSEVMAICDESDVIVACFGLNANIEGEQGGDESNPYDGGDKRDLLFPGIQMDVLKKAYGSGKPVIMVNLSGSAMDLSIADKNSNAIIQGWYPGATGGRAIADLIFGEFSPSGKTPLTFYSNSNKLPDFEDYSMKNETYRFMEEKPLYPFGFGLSYSDCDITYANINGDKVKDNLKISLKVKNNGKYVQEETIQVYIKYENSFVKNPQLKKIEKVVLKPKKEQNLDIVLPISAFGLYDDKGEYNVNKGKFEVYVGLNQPDERSIELTGKKPYKFEIVSDEKICLE